MNKCIIISGKSGAGKDMLAHFMKEELEKNGKRCCKMGITRFL